MNITSKFSNANARVRKVIKSAWKSVASTVRNIVGVIGTLISKTWRFLADNLRDILFFGGLFMMGYGLWKQLFPTYNYVSLISCGVLLMLFGLGWLSRLPKNNVPKVIP